jgi:flagellar biosynthetic protein FliR
VGRNAFSTTPLARIFINENCSLLLVAALPFVVLAVRFGGIFESLPGIGGDEFGPQFRYFAVLLIALAITMCGVRAPEPASMLETTLVLMSEFALGFAMGSIPTMVLGGLGVAGQVISGSIGLGQANMIDRSLGGNVSIISKIKVMLATAVFLSIDGHHAIIRAASGLPGEIGFGLFRPDMSTAMVLAQQLSNSFELALSVSAPVIVTTLVTQFVLGLITKFVPQVNIFIISLPLTLLIGLFLVAYSMPGIVEHVHREFLGIEETVGRLAAPGEYVPAP